MKKSSIRSLSLRCVVVAVICVAVVVGRVQWFVPVSTTNFATAFVIIPTTITGNVHYYDRTITNTKQRRLWSQTTNDDNNNNDTDGTLTARTVKQVVCPDCDLCDGSGRIPGGIGAVISWIPIKAFRPCPNFIDRGGMYERAGQGLDEIAFGRDSTFTK